MIILDNLRIVGKQHIDLPNWLRGPLSLKHDTAVSICIVPFSQHGDASRLCEMIVSPIKFESWGDVWRITAEFRDGPGVVNKFLNVLSERRVNFLAEESSSTASRTQHSLELVIDAQGYQTELDKSSGERRNLAAPELTDLMHRLMAVSGEDLLVEGGRNPRMRLSIRRMESLHSAWKSFVTSSLDDALPSPVEVRSSIQNRKLVLPTNIRNLIEEYANPQQVGKGIRSKKPRVLMSIDTEERILRGYFPMGDENLVYVRVEHKEEIGALAHITHVLKDEFDIIASFTRLQNKATGVNLT